MTSTERLKELSKTVEFSEISFSCAAKAERLDAEFYQKEYLALEKISNTFSTTIHDIDLGVPKNTKRILDKEVKYVEISGVSCKNLDYEFTVFPKGELLPDRAQNVLTEKNILISTVRPNRNAVAFVDKLDGGIASSGFKVLKVDESKTTPEYIFCLCKTDYFIKNMMRANKATMYPAVNGGDVDALRIPVFPILAKKITELFNDAVIKMNESKRIYNLAKDKLDSLFVFDDSVKEKCSIKSLSKAFLDTGRLDAEYYQEKYDNLFDELNKFHCEPLSGSGGLVDIVKSIEPGSEYYREEGIPFVRVSNFSVNGINTPDIKLPFDIVDNPSDLYPKKDTILLTKDGSIGMAYKLDKDLEMITSGAILHLIPRKNTTVLPEYLTLVLNSKIVRLQAERDTNGAVIQHWKPDEISKVKIPVIDLDIQKELSDLVSKSKELRKESELILQKAINAVEIGIEKGEQKAIDSLLIKDGQ